MYFILSNIVVSSLAVEGLLSGCVVVVLCVYFVVELNATSRRLYDEKLHFESTDANFPKKFFSVDSIYFITVYSLIFVCEFRRI